MRVFIAIDISKDIRAALQEAQEKITQAGATEKDYKWTRPEAIHLTLKFLGEINDENLIEICKIVKEVTRRHNKFELAFEKMGFFGGRSPRVLWAGCGKGNDQLCEIQNDLEKSLAQAGWPEENRKFSGHLTLCRIKDRKAGARLIELCEDYKDLKFGTMMAESVSVYQSQLTKKGAVYTRLADYELLNQKELGEI